MRGKGYDVVMFVRRHTECQQKGQQMEVGDECSELHILP